jgi:hypothetical protein
MIMCALYWSSWRTLIFVDRKHTYNACQLTFLGATLTLWYVVNKQLLFRQWYPCFRFVFVVYWNTGHLVIIWGHINREEFEDTKGGHLNPYIEEE